MSPVLRKAVVGVLGLVLLAFAGASFRRSRSLKEPVVAGPGLTRVVRLGDYFDGVRGTINDANVYVLEGAEPGGTVVILGGTHAEEPAGRLAGWILAEQAVVRSGRVFVVLSANRSATTATRLGGAYPGEYAIRTPWGEQAFRTGDRWSNPLDQWPDPEVFVHYPSRQQLAYVDIRNLNRAFPGRPDGTLTERTCHAIIELIRREKADLLIDLHEAELQYPVISAIVAHQKGQDLAALAAMTISAKDGFNMGVEYSPLALHGLSHREVGDHTDAISLLLEAPEPFLDATRGRTDADLLLTGRDPFVVRAGKRGLLFEKIDENGWPIDVRVGRHTSAILRILEVWSSDRSERAVVIEGLPGYDEVIAKGVGAFLRDPSSADPKSVYFE